MLLFAISFIIILFFISLIVMPSSRRALVLYVFAYLVFYAWLSYLNYIPEEHREDDAGSVAAQGVFSIVFLALFVGFLAKYTHVLVKQLEEFSVVRERHICLCKHTLAITLFILFLYFIFPFFLP